MMQKSSQVHVTSGNKLIFDVERIREDFPILKRIIHNKPLVYLDNAATTQKPRSVIDAIENYYKYENSNIHRGIHYLSSNATQAYEKAREKVRDYINAEHIQEIIFVRGATEGVNLIASSFGDFKIEKNDEIIISAMEHHSNIVPWQILCEKKGAHLRVIPLNDDGEIIFDEYKKLLSNRIKLVAITHVSNAIGTVNPVKEMISMAHSHGIPVLVDGAQAIPHRKIDVREIDCDFYVFSGHKMFGPTGIGVLYGKLELLESIPPYQAGGDMIKSVKFEKTTFSDCPYKFEAGTPHIAGGIGLGAAIDYLRAVDIEKIEKYESELLEYATEQMISIKKLRIIGKACEKVGVISFIIDGIHPHDIGTILDNEGIAIRTGHQCAQPLMDRMGIPATARVSFAFYNTKEEIDVLIKGIHKVIKVLG